MQHTTFDWNQIEDRIRPHVKALRDAGYETTGSCGHEMWISLDIKPMEVPAIYETLKRLGYRDFEVTYSIHEGFSQWKGAKVQFGGDLAGDGKPFDLVLLKVDPAAHPLFFVVRARRYNDSDIEEAAAHDGYFYDEHTCPTNWISDVVAIVSHGDEDPHGFATFVTRRAPPEKMDENGDQEDGPSWVELFPETIKDVAEQEF